ncbi:MAG TPA: phosphoribosylanthranilate isomerase [Rudaea sp.]|nr:phosphoribosylanthranilate isomerase [Rudaea sp.]
MIARVRIKFCGMTRVADVRNAVTLGVDAIGLVMTRKSARRVELQHAGEIRAAIPPFVAAVALFMDDDPGWIREAVAAFSPDLLQFHGSESATHCTCYDRAYLKAVAMGGGANAGAVIEQHPDAAGFVLDGHVAGELGGSGQRFDWSRVPRDLRQPLILAGGLTCDNVTAAIRTAQPFAVDVSSGIESAPGIKDVEKMRRFVEAVHQARNSEYANGVTDVGA